MNKFTLALIMVFGITLSGCGEKKNEITKEVDTTTKTEVSTPVEKDKADKKDDADDTMMKLGVEECDSYLASLTKCIESLTPESASQYRSALKQTEEQWKKIPKDGLKDICVQAQEQAKTVYEPLGCTF